MLALWTIRATDSAVTVAVQIVQQWQWIASGSEAARLYRPIGRATEYRIVIGDLDNRYGRRVLVYLEVQMITGGTDSTAGVTERSYDLAARYRRKLAPLWRPYAAVDAREMSVH
jgi:hypothetical protein